MLKASNKSSKGAMSRRHLPFCRLDNRTIYLGIHFLLPFAILPRTLPNSFIITVHTDYILSVDLPSQTCTLQKLNLQQQRTRASSLSTRLTIWAGKWGHGQSCLPPLLPLPIQSHAQTQTDRKTDGRADTDTGTDIGARTHPHAHT